MIDPCRTQYYTIKSAQETIQLLKSRFPNNYGEQIEFRRAMDAIRIAKDKIAHFERMKRMGVKF